MILFQSGKKKQFLNVNSHSSLINPFQCGLSSMYFKYPPNEGALHK